MAWKKATNKFVRRAYGKRKIHKGRAFSFTGTIKPKLSGSGRSSTKKLYKHWKLGFASLVVAGAYTQGARKAISLANYSTAERDDLRRIRKNQQALRKQIAVNRMRASNSFQQGY